MKYQIREITNGDQIADLSDSAIHYQLLQKIYGKEIRCYALKDKGDNSIGFFCVYSFNKLWQKHIITPPFLTDIQLNTQCAAKNASQINNFYRDVISSIARFLKGTQHTYLELVLPEYIKDALPFIWEEFKVGIRYSYYLDLMTSEEELLQNMSTQRRKNIRDASKLNLEIKKITNPETIYSKAVETLSTKNAKFNENIVKKLSDLSTTEHLIAIGVYENEQLVALSASLTTPLESTYLFGWNTNESSKSFLGTYALWNCIMACKKKSKSFNFAGSQIPSIEKYFRGFGARLTPMISVVSDKRKLTRQFT